jgi:hypothetical protein
MPAACPARGGGFELWPLALADGDRVEVAVLSMGNPHAVQRVDDVETAPVALGPADRAHERFARGVNAGFMQVVSPREVAAACLRTRRRRDPGLRHRGLRRGGGRHPAGLAGRAGRGRTRGGDLSSPGPVAMPPSS